MITKFISPSELFSVRRFLSKKAFASLDKTQMEWVEEKLNKIKSGNFKDLYLAFSSASRVIQEDLLNQVTEDEILELNILRRGLDISGWTLTQTLRMILLCEFPIDNAEQYTSVIKNIYATSDLEEQQAILKGLAVLPWQERFIEIAESGVRSNVKILFEGIAERNPYPFDYFSEPEWNQMVIKMLFIDNSINEIYGLDRRCNPSLTRMAIDLIHERWAAGRIVNPEIWRIIYPFMSHKFSEDIVAVFENENLSVYRKAVALACFKSSSREANNLLADKNPDLQNMIINGSLDWDQIANEWRNIKFQPR
ncbi:MAG: EboA domain-containing protein [Cytophagaceae bacterium]